MRSPEYRPSVARFRHTAAVEAAKRDAGVEALVYLNMPHSHLTALASALKSQSPDTTAAPSCSP
jgi:hypothetical protein